MKREEMEALITEFDWSIPTSKWGRLDPKLMAVRNLARLGASVAAPTEAEIEWVANSLIKDYQFISYDDEAREQLRRQELNNKSRDIRTMFAALLALKDPADV